MNSIKTLLFLTLLASPAYAVMGEQVKVANVQKMEKFSVSSDPNDKVRVKEFFDKSGNVFGVCYDPRGTKDLDKIMGSKYSALFAKAIRESKQVKNPRLGVHPRVQVIKNDEIYIRSIKIGRSLTLCVLDPKKLPEGVSGNEVH